MAQFHSLPFNAFPSIGQGVSGDLYYASDRSQLFVCAEGYLLPVDGILSGGIQLGVGPQGPPGPPGAPGIPTNEEIGSFDLLQGAR
jgi:hypothetical protein